MKEKIFTVIVALGLFLPAMAVLAYNLYIDPFQIFHKDLRQPTVLLGGRGTDRYQHAGIINQYDIGSVIIGHSHSANYRPSELTEELGWNTVYTLTVDGGTLFEQAMIARRALSKNAVEHVLWGFSIDNMMRPWGNINQKLPMKEYLYDENRLNDISFFLTLGMQEYHKQKQERKKEILGAPNSLQLAKDEFDKATFWYKREGNKCGFNRPAYVAGKILGKQKHQYNEAIKSRMKRLPSDVLVRGAVSNSKYVSYYSDNLHNNLLPIIKHHPNVLFDFIITAFPTLKLQRMKANRLKYYKDYLLVLRQFVLDTQEFPNVKIFAFDTEKFTDDLRLYKDRTHYHPAVNSFIVKEIAKGNNLLTPLNIDAFIAALDEKVSRYRLKNNWNPKGRKKYQRFGYLSTEAADLLINGSSTYSDAEITNIAFQDPELPKCAERIRKRGDTNQ